jgi:hypothetical protein
LGGVTGLSVEDLAIELVQLDRAGRGDESSAHRNQSGQTHDDGPAHEG